MSSRPVSTDRRKSRPVKRGRTAYPHEPSPLNEQRCNHERRRKRNKHDHPGQRNLCSSPSGHQKRLDQRKQHPEKRQ
jgi:hypothetical protein